MSADATSEPRPAATVVVVRPDAHGRAEVLLLKRHAGAGFMANVWVFPGGRVDAADGEHGDAFVCAATRETAEEAGIALSGELAFCAHWVTPPSEKKRFDTRFYLTTVAAGTEATPDTTEVTAAQWLTPEAALARHAEIDLPLSPPTWLTLHALVGMTPAQTWAWATAQQPIAMTPSLVLNEGRLEVRTELGVLALVRGRWQLA